jgi:hypothetical protein
MRHTLESNFTIIKGLSSSKDLGMTKFQFRDMLTPKEIEFSYKMIYYKKAADEYKVGFVKSGRIFLSEYSKGILKETFKIKIK